MIKGNRTLARFYFVMMIACSAIPVMLATPHLQTFGFSPLIFTREANLTSAARAVFADLCLAALVYMIFCWIDVKRRRAAQWEFWVTLALLPVGLITSVAFYLWRRELNPASATAGSAAGTTKS